MYASKSFLIVALYTLCLMDQGYSQRVTVRAHSLKPKNAQNDTKLQPAVLNSTTHDHQNNTVHNNGTQAKSEREVSKQCLVAVYKCTERRTGCDPTNEKCRCDVLDFTYGQCLGDPEVERLALDCAGNRYFKMTREMWKSQCQLHKLNETMNEVLGNETSTDDFDMVPRPIRDFNGGSTVSYSTGALTLLFGYILMLI